MTPTKRTSRAPRLPALHRGDRVAWSSHGRTAKGRVEKKITEPTEIKGHHVAASPANPQYIVRSDRSGGRAAHRRSALRKLPDR